jgi:hypothetical protein
MTQAMPCRRVQKMLGGCDISRSRGEDGIAELSCLPRMIRIQGDAHLRSVPTLAGKNQEGNGKLSA